MQDGEPTGKEVPILHEKNVLLVEDCPEDAEKYAAILVAAGARVESVGSLGAALQALANRRWDLLLTDRLLPDGDMFEWLRRQHRDHGSGAWLPACVLVSRHMDPDTYRLVYELGALPLPKHYILHADVLMAAIDSAFAFAMRRANGEVDPR